MDKLPRSLTVTSTAPCAALYAVCSFATAYIQSPWGMGQFRPAVIVPAFFAVVFGPWVGGVGAAVGTLICDSIKHGTLYMGSLIAAVPGNFVGFYLLGYVIFLGINAFPKSLMNLHINQILKCIHKSLSFNLFKLILDAPQIGHAKSSGSSP